ncbi:RNA polymerase sigma factor [bacterium]|nr:RNA polymerase sigma factor [bacterium]
MTRSAQETPLDELDDAALIALARTREPRSEAAFRSLYERYRDEVFSFLVRLVRDEVQADDLVQDVFLRVHASLDRFHPERSFRAWVYQIARNAAVDALRSKRKEARIVDESAQRARAKPDSPVVPEVSRREQVLSAREALEQLPPEIRAMLIQRFGLGMKIEELAQSWSCTERTALTRLQSAVSALARGILAQRNAAGWGGEGRSSSHAAEGGRS